MANMQMGAPMLGLLDGMYENWKEKIGEANKKEHEQKLSFDKTIADLEVKKAKSKDSKDGAETYDRIEKYWKRQRAIAPPVPHGPEDHALRHAKVQVRLWRHEECDSWQKAQRSGS